MAGESKHGMECAEFEALLSAALDERLDDGSGRRLESQANDGDGLGAARRETFEAHRRACAICGPMFAEVQAGQHWLRELAAEPVEPPKYLVRNILAATSGVLSTRSLSAAAGDGRTTPFGERMRERWDAFFTPVAAFVRQPRFAMSFGMIFFSFSLALNVAGVKAKDLAKVDLRPGAVRHAYIDAQVKVVKYYDNIRFVYEIESKLRELKRANAPTEPGPEYRKDEPKDKRNNDTSGQPEQKQDRNYSQEQSEPVLEADRGGPQALKRGVFSAGYGTTEVVPFPVGWSDANAKLSVGGNGRMV